jgi:hypothetical protein
MRDFKFFKENNGLKKTNQYISPGMVFAPYLPAETTEDYYQPVREQNVLVNENDYINGIINFLSVMYNTDAFRIGQYYNTVENDGMISFAVNHIDYDMNPIDGVVIYTFTISYQREHRNFELVFSCNHNFQNVQNARITLLNNF